MISCSWIKPTLVACAACASVLRAQTIDVPLGTCRQLPAGTVLTGDVLVKTGGGTLDLSLAILNNEGLDIREGAVRVAALDKPGPVQARFVRFTVHASRPDAPYSGHNWQIAEFNVTRDGKPLPHDAGVVGSQYGESDGREGPAKAVDNNVKTKFLTTTGHVLDVDFGKPVLFDGYTFTTANDATGRDPRDFTLKVGDKGSALVCWSTVSMVKGFVCTEKRFAPAGKIFPVMRLDKIPCEYAVHVGGRARLVLCGLTESLENISGEGLVCLEGGSLEILPPSAFGGSVAGDGLVKWN